MISRSLTVLFSSLVVSAALPLAHAEEKEFDQTTEVSGVGFVRIVHRIPGEPIMSPDRFEVFVRCHRDKKEKLVERLSICDLKSYNLDKKTKLVSVSFLSGRTDPSDGATHCDIPEDRDIKLDTVCKKKKK